MNFKWIKWIHSIQYFVWEMEKNVDDVKIAKKWVNWNNLLNQKHPKLRYCTSPLMSVKDEKNALNILVIQKHPSNLRQKILNKTSKSKRICRQRQRKRPNNNAIYAARRMESKMVRGIRRKKINCVNDSTAPIDSKGMMVFLLRIYNVCVFVGPLNLDFSPPYPL